MCNHREPERRVEQVLEEGLEVVVCATPKMNGWEPSISCCPLFLVVVVNRGSVNERVVAYSGVGNFTPLAEVRR